MSRLWTSSSPCIHHLLALLIVIGETTVNAEPHEWYIVNISDLSLHAKTTYNETETVNLRTTDDVVPSATRPVSLVSITNAILMTRMSDEESSVPELGSPGGNVTVASWPERENNVTEKVEELDVAMPTSEMNGTLEISENTSVMETPSDVGNSTQENATEDLVPTKPSLNVIEVNTDGYGGPTTLTVIQEPTSTEPTQEPDGDTNQTSQNLQGEVAATEMPSTMDKWPRTTMSFSSTPETNELPTTLVWFILILEGNCSLVSSKSHLEEDFKMGVVESVAPWLRTSVKDLTVGQNACPSNDKIHINLTLYRDATGVNISEQLNALEDSAEPLLELHGQSFYVYKIVTVDGFLSKEPRIPTDLRHSDVELLVYITVGSICAFLLALAIILLMCKYCDCREQKPFDFGEAPNLNMRLEDYTLTRIPRPKLGYVDYYRGLTRRYCPLDDKMTTSPNGMVQPFDTSVVPLEDDRALDARSAPVSTFRDCHDGVIIRPSDIHRFSRMCRTGRPTSSASGYLTDADGYCIRSTENLNHWPKEDQYADKGVDNPNFQ